MAVKRSAVIGLDELDKTLRDLAKQVDSATLIKALKMGGEVIADEARSRVPVASGRLRDSIVVRRSNRRQMRRHGAVVLVGPKGGRDGAPYAHLVEFGTSPHVIKAPKNKFLRIGAYVLRRQVRHPGARAHPFMRPAIDGKRDEALSVIKDELWRSIEKTAKQ